MCEKQMQKLRWGLRGGTTRMGIKESKNTALTIMNFFLLIKKLLLKLKCSKLGLKLLLLFGKMLNITNQFLHKVI